MAAPQFSVGVDANPILVEQTIDKTLDQIIKERREKQGARTGRGSKTAAPGGKQDAAKRKAGQVAKSVGTAKAKREAALAKRRGISETSKPEPSQIDAQVQRTKGKHAKKKAVKDAEALVASTKGASKAKARKKRSKAATGGVKDKAMTASQEKRGGPRPGGKKQGAGPGGHKQAPPKTNGKGFNIGVRAGKRQQQQEQQQAPAGRPTRRRRGGGGGAGIGGGAGGVGVRDGRPMAASQPITAKSTRRPRRKKRGADADGGSTGGASSTTFTFTPDRNLKISFRAGSGGGSGRSGGQYPGGSYVHGSPDGVGRRSTDASKSFRSQPQSAVGAISSASALSSSSLPPFDNGFREGGRGGRRAARFTPPPRTFVAGNGNGSRRAGPKDVLRPQTYARDRMMTTTRNSRASTIDARRRNRQGGSYNGSGGREGRGGNEEAPRRVIILGNGH